MIYSDDKTRANAAGAIGNFARNGGGETCLCCRYKVILCTVPREPVIDLMVMDVCTIFNSTELCQALCDAECPQQLLSMALRDTSVFPKRIALFSLGTLVAYDHCKNALLAASPSVSDVIRWYRKPQEAPEVLLCCCHYKYSFLF